jgi:hypothetical protein
MGFNKQKMVVPALILAMLMAGVSSAVEETYTRQRYELIVERSPFGNDPVITPEPDNSAQEAAAAAAAAKKLEKELRLCFLLETEEGEIRAGFQNLKAQPGDPRNVMLMVGESFQGLKLRDIDLENSRATLVHLGKPVTFELSKAPASATESKPASAAKPPQRRFGGGFRRPAKPEPAKPPEPQLSPEEQARRREEVRENLRQYQMEVIRAGMPPLPIPLTQEMDDQLVSEGVLPPE